MTHVIPEAKKYDSDWKRLSADTYEPIWIVIILTKLSVPCTSSSLVSRPRLHEQIAQGLRGPLMLITAPAGFGKTALMASYIPGCGMPVAWLSLDKNDNQEERFLNYLVA